MRDNEDRYSIHLLDGDGKPYKRPTAVFETPEGVAGFLLRVCGGCNRHVVRDIKNNKAFRAGDFVDAVQRKGGAKK